MYFQELFTESRKLFPLSCSDATKLAPTRSFSGKCTEKLAKILTAYLKMLFFWLQIISETPILAWWFHLMSFWEFLRFRNFCPFWGARKLKKQTFFEKKVKFLTLSAQKLGQKLKKSQITFVKLIKWDHYAKNWASRVIWSQKNNFSRNEKSIFMPIFPYIFGQKCAQGPTLTSHSSATVWN